MTSRAKTHRASAQRRRDALLQAAAELAAELGAGAVTHRAVAARAGVPLSTTSYFFDSIDDLVTEALRASASERGAEIDSIQALEILRQDLPASTMIDAVVDQAIATDRVVEGGQLEYFLAAGRQPELSADASAVVERETRHIADDLARCGAPQAADAAWAVTALGDGAMVHRVARVDLDHRHRLGAGLRLLLAAAMLGSDEIDELLGRYGSAAAGDGEASWSRPSLQDS